jgi:hypothetical protein
MMKKNRIILVAASLPILSGSLKNVEVIEDEKKFESPSVDFTGETLPVNNPVIQKSNPWPEPHRSSKKRKRY